MSHPAGSAPPVPRYGRAALADVTPSLLAALGVPGERNVLGLAPAPRACLLLVDGLGWEQLQAHQRHAPYLGDLAAQPAGTAPRVLTAGFPATTATSMGSLGTGLPPGEHGLCGLRLAAPGAGRLLNCLRWDEWADPLWWQPRRTVFERAEAAGVAASYVASGAIRHSGLTRAALRGARYVPAESPGELVAGARAAAEAGERALVCAYYAELDATGHRCGCHSPAWRFELGHVDRLAAQLAGELPPGTALYVTGDHGMIDVDPDQRVDADRVPALRKGVALLGGEPRARHVYAAPGAAGDVLAAWREVLGRRMWVVSGEEAVASGWFGPHVPDGMRDRIGDVVAAARDGAAVITGKAEPHEAALVGQHGSMTPDEQHIPLLATV